MQLMKNSKMAATMALILFSLLSGMTHAFSLTGSATEKGLTIAHETERRDMGWNNSSSDMIMLLQDRMGRESQRKIRSFNLEMIDDGDKSLIIFDSPKDVRGTGFLTYSHVQSADDQWMFLPAIKRVKRIASKNKSGPFMGSEFAYEDISSFEVEKYSHEYIGEEIINGVNCYQIKMVPQYEHSKYSKLIMWVDQDEFRPQKTDFYDRKDALLKTRLFQNYESYLERYWRAHKIIMNNHQNGKSTELLWSNYQFNVGLDAKNFSKNALKRVR